MFSKVLLLLIVAGSLCLLIYPATALMQSAPQDFRLEVFDPTGRSTQSQTQAQQETLRLEVIDPITQAVQPMSMTVFDPNDPQSAGYRGTTAAAANDNPSAASDMR